MEKVLIIIPAYNEEQNIRGVVDDVANCNKQYDALVINDCSTDNTSEISKNTGKCIVIDLSVNLGIGGAVQTGFKYAANNEYDYAVQFDGDGQHEASEIPKLLSSLKNNKADVVIGSRFINREPNFKSSFSRRIGIFLLKMVNSLLIKQVITDNTSGFRAYNKEAILFLSRNYPEDYPEPESIVVLGRNNFRIQEIPVKMKKRENGKSSINGVKIPYYMLKVILSVLLVGMRKKIRDNSDN